MILKTSRRIGIRADVAGLFTIVLAIVFYSTSPLAAQRTENLESATYAKDTRSCVDIELSKLEFLEPEKLDVPPDVILIKDDDYYVDFNFVNRCEETIHYLGRRSYLQKHSLSYIVQVFMLYSDDGTIWNARVPTWRRERAFVDSAYKWITLKQNESASFRLTDISEHKGMRRVAFYVSYGIEPVEITEVMTEPFDPLSQLKK